MKYDLDELALLWLYVPGVAFTCYCIGDPTLDIITDSLYACIDDCETEWDHVCDGVFTQKQLEFILGTRDPSYVYLLT